MPLSNTNEVQAGSLASDATGVDSPKDRPINLLGIDRAGMRSLMERWGESPYRGDQVFQWLHQMGMQDFDGMTNISKKLRARLRESAVVEPARVTHESIASDGTVKWMSVLKDGNAIETVFIPEAERGTLCISSQAGCMLNCSFCSTARQGFNRNLTSDEIISQVWYASRQLGSNEQGNRRITNIVLMGMGEPLLNFENVVVALNIILDDFAYGLSKRRVTLSTAGVVPAIDKLKEIAPVALAISLHAPNDALRNELVPVNKKYPIKELVAACKRYVVGEARRRVTVEYVMLKDVNDSLDHARELVKCLNGLPAKINLIPFNSFPGSTYVCSDQNQIDLFRDYLLAKGIVTVTRKTRGDDIDAACGQLVGQVMDRTRRSEKMKKPFSGNGIGTK